MPIAGVSEGDSAEQYMPAALIKLKVDTVALAAIVHFHFYVLPGSYDSRQISPSSFPGCVSLQACERHGIYLSHFITLNPSVIPTCQQCSENMRDAALLVTATAALPGLPHVATSPFSLFRPYTRLKQHSNGLWCLLHRL